MTDQQERALDGFLVAAARLGDRRALGRLVQLSTLLRSFMGMQFEANRVIRELKRLELRIVRLEARRE